MKMGSLGVAGEQRDLNHICLRALDSNDGMSIGNEGPTKLAGTNKTELRTHSALKS